MPDERRPFTHDQPNAHELERLKLQAAKRNLVAAYKRCFATDSGKTVLADLKRAFKFGTWEGKDTASTEEVARRALAKGPLYHVEEMLNTTLSASPQPRRKKGITTP